jgi:hypothetical protein
MATLDELVNKVPPLDEKGAAGRPDSEGKFTGLRWETAIPIFDEVLAGGSNNIVGLVDLLKEVDNGADYRARYMIHGVALYLCRKGKEKEKAMFTETLASQLGSASRAKPIQAFIIRELQVCGDKNCVPTIGKLLLDEQLGDPAAAAITAIREGAVEQFRAAAPQAKGHARLTIVQSLGVLGDAQSAPLFKDAAADPDVETRLAGVWSLANVADASAVDLVIKASNTEGWERIKSVKACLVLAEKLAAAGKKDDARKIYTHLRDSRTDPKEQYVKEAASRGLAGL